MNNVESASGSLPAYSRWHPYRASAANHRQASGFTLIELLVVIAIIAILAAMLLPVLSNSKERALRTSCASNLKQVGVGVYMYASDNGEYLPQRSWPQGQNPWQSYEVCRVNAGDGKTITRGPYNLGLLFFTKAVPDGEVFYCPSLNRDSSSKSYSYYATQGFPSTPVGQNDDNVRAAFNFYPQPKDTETVSTSYGTFDLPIIDDAGVKITFIAPDGTQNTVNEYTPPLKMANLDPKKSMCADELMSYASLNHKSSGKPGGVNVLFGDDHVKFVTVRANSRKGSYLPFDPNLWSDLSGGPGPGSDKDAFRIIVNAFQP